MQSVFDRYEDSWFFCALLSDGTVLDCETIEPTSDPAYLGVWLHKDRESSPVAFGKKASGALTTRSYCLVKKDAILAIQEYADS